MIKLKIVNKVYIKYINSLQTIQNNYFVEFKIIFAGRLVSTFTAHRCNNHAVLRGFITSLTQD